MANILSICSVHARHSSKNISYILLFNPHGIHGVSVVIFLLQIRKLSHTGIYLYKIISQRHTLPLFHSKDILASCFSSDCFRMLPFLIWHPRPCPFAYMGEVRQARGFPMALWVKGCTVLEPRASESWSVTLPPETDCLLSAPLTRRSLPKTRASVGLGDLESWRCYAVTGRAL